MYVDKKLHDIKAVQTLSRLNRIFGNKKLAERDCFVVDFENDREEIQKAFQKYYGAIELEGEVTLDDLYKTKVSVENCGLTEQTEIDDFFEKYAQKLAAEKNFDFEKTNRLSAEIKKVIALVVKRYKNCEEQIQNDFRDKCRHFVKKFLFLQNVINIEDNDLIKFGLYICAIIKPLNVRSSTPPSGKKDFTIEELLDLSDFRIDDKIVGSIKLVKENETTVHPSGDGNSIPVSPTITTLHKLVTELNKKYGTDFTAEDIVPAINTFKKSFEEDKGFCNKTVLSQEAMFSAKYNGRDGDTVIYRTLKTKKINKKLSDVIKNNQNFYTDFKAELKFPVYEHLKEVLSA